jgi:exonuclease VII small subunit
MTSASCLTEAQSKNGENSMVIERKALPLEDDTDEPDDDRSERLQSHGQNTSVDIICKGEKRPSRTRSASVDTQSVTEAVASRSLPPTISSYRLLEENVLNLKKRNRELEEQKVCLERGNDAYQTQIRELKHANQTLQGQKKNLQQQVDECEEQKDKLEDDLDDITAFYSHIVRAYFVPYAKKQNMQYNDKIENSVKRVLGSLLRDALEANELRAQVQELQTDMLAKVDKLQAMSDEKFCLNFGTLASSIKTFSRAIKLSSTVSITDIVALNQCLLLRGVQTKYWNTGARRKGMIEAYVWSVLIKYVFRSPFHMLGSVCGQFSHGFTGLFGQLHTQGWPTPCELAERWKCTTAERLVELVGSEASLEELPENVHPEIVESMKRLRSDLYKVIESTFVTLSPTTDFLQLHAIVDKAIKLALQMSLQRSRIQIVWPNVGDPFLSRETRSLKNITDEDVEEGTVAFIINPGLAKWGDAHGKNLHKRLDLVPSRVFIESGSTETETIGDGKVTQGIALSSTDLDLLEKQVDATSSKMDGSAYAAQNSVSSSGGKKLD